MRVQRAVCASQNSPCIAQTFYRGITIFEVVVVIAIIGVLLAITLPAVQRARGVARRTQCALNLHQIGIAIDNYASDWGVYPIGARWEYHLLKYVEQQAIADIPLDSLTEWAPLNRFVIPVFICPDDPASRTVGVTAATNYAACSGSGTQRYGFNGMFNYGMPLGRYRGGFIRPQDVEHGLSNTVAVSEILHGNATFSRLRVNWHTVTALQAPDQLDEFADSCDAIPPDPIAFGWRGVANRGLPWYDGTLGCGMYNHVLCPNRPSCNNGGGVFAGAYTAASEHVGGVECLYGDGHVAFVGNSVDRKVWREMGSRVENYLQ